MNAALTIPALYPLLPEIVLGLGAMALLMFGVYRGERSVRTVDYASVALLIIAGLIVLALPAGKLVTFDGSFVVDGFARFLKVLAIIGSAAAILMSIDHAERERQQRFEYSILIVLSTLGMLMLISAADLIALYRRPRIDEPAALRRGREPPQFAALDRSGIEVFRARRAVLGNAAVRRLAGLRLHRHGRVSPASRTRPRTPARD